MTCHLCCKTEGETLSVRPSIYRVKNVIKNRKSKNREDVLRLLTSRGVARRCDRLDRLCVCVRDMVMVMVACHVENALVFHNVLGKPLEELIHFPVHEFHGRERCLLADRNATACSTQQYGDRPCNAHKSTDAGLLACCMLCTMCMARQGQACTMCMARQGQACTMCMARQGQAATGDVAIDRPGLPEIGGLTWRILLQSQARGGRPATPCS